MLPECVSCCGMQLWAQGLRRHNGYVQLRSHWLFHSSSASLGWRRVSLKRERQKKDGGFSSQVYLSKHITQHWDAKERVKFAEWFSTHPKTHTSAFAISSAFKYTQIFSVIDIMTMNDRKVAFHPEQALTTFSQQQKNISSLDPLLPREKTVPKLLVFFAI